MKRAAILAMVVILLALSVTPALAQEKQLRYRFQLTGTVEEVDVAAGTITVSIIGYSSQSPVASTRLTIQTTEQTQFSWAREANATEVKPPTIENVEIGEKIAVRGMIREQVHVATQVILRLQVGTPAPTRTPQPEATRFNLMGDVEAVDTEAGTITVKVTAYSSNDNEWPERLTIQTTNETQYQWGRPASATEPDPPGIDDVEVGEQIAVRGMIREQVHVATQITLRYGQITPSPTRTPVPVDERFALTGVVEAVDVGAGAITVSVLTYAPNDGDWTNPLLIQITNETIFAYAPPANVTDPNAPTIEDVFVGEKSLHTWRDIEEDVHVAIQVMLRRPQATRPTRPARRGSQQTPCPRCTPTPGSQKAA